MIQLSDEINKLLKKKNLGEITIASDEGLTVVSTADKKKAESLSAGGAYQVHEKLANNSNLHFITEVGREGLRYTYSDKQFNYVIKSPTPLDEETIKGLREVLDKDAKEKEKRRQERLKEVEKKKQERQARLEEIQKIKERRMKRIEEIEKQKEKREERLEEIEKKKEERDELLEEIEKKKEERDELQDEITEKKSHSKKKKKK